MDPANVSSLLVKGRDCFVNSKFEEALKYLDAVRRSRSTSSASDHTQAIKLNPDYHAGYNSRSSVHEKLGDLKRAFEDAKKAITLAPDHWQGYAQSARLFFKLRKHAESLATIEKALQLLKPDSRHLKNIHSLRDTVSLEMQLLAEHRSRHAYHFGKLPVELVVEIFYEVVFEDRSPGAVRLSLVCRQWRRIALSTPKLWEELELLAPGGIARKVNAWRERSRSAISKLWIRTQAETQICRAFQQFSLEEFKNLRWIYMEDCTEFLALFGARLINLEELMVNNSGNTCGGILMGLRGTPLRLLRLQGIYVSGQFLAENFNTLTDLYCAELVLDSHSHLFNFLAANPLLQALHLRVIYQDLDSNYGPRSSITLQNLQLLDLGRVSVIFFQKVLMPALRHLSLRDVDHLDIIFHELIRQKINLTELSIGYSRVYIPAMIRFLQASPLLESLRIGGVTDVANGVAEALASPTTLPHDSSATPPASQKTIICPSLVKVEFEGCPDLRTGALVRLVKSRLPDAWKETDRQPSPLRDLRVHYCPLIDAEAAPWFRSKVERYTCSYDFSGN